MKPNVAIVGLGWWGKHIQRVIEGPESPMNLVATVDVNASENPTTSDIQSILINPEIEAVILCTPHSLHADQIVMCAESGKNVFCEKPLALNTVDALRAVSACSQRGLVLGIGHERRFEPGIVEIKRMIQMDELGTILHAETSFSHDLFKSLPAGNWRGSLAEAPAAGMTAMGIHLTDMLISCFGEVSTVYAITTQRFLAFDTGDVLSVQLQFKNGITASISALSATPFYSRIAIFGSSSWVEMRDNDHPEKNAGTQITTCGHGESPTSNHQPALNTTLANLTAFADAITGKSVYPFTNFDLIHNISVLEAIIKSAATLEVVAVENENLE